MRHLILGEKFIYTYELHYFVYIMDIIFMFILLTDWLTRDFEFEICKDC